MYFICDYCPTVLRLYKIIETDSVSCAYFEMKVKVILNLQYMSTLRLLFCEVIIITNMYVSLIYCTFFSLLADINYSILVTNLSILLSIHLYVK